MMVFRRRGLLELVENVSDCTIQLRVAPVLHLVGGVAPSNARADALISGDPLVALRRPDPDLRQGQPAAIQQRRAAVDTDQSAPGALADDRADTRLTEVVREGVAAGTRPLVL